MVHPCVETDERISQTKPRAVGLLKPMPSLEKKAASCRVYCMSMLHYGLSMTWCTQEMELLSESWFPIVSRCPIHGFTHIFDSSVSRLAHQDETEGLLQLISDVRGVSLQAARERISANQCSRNRQVEPTPTS